MKKVFFFFFFPVRLSLTRVTFTVFISFGGFTLTGEIFRTAQWAHILAIELKHTLRFRTRPSGPPRVSTIRLKEPYDQDLAQWAVPAGVQPLG